jgi:flagellar biosynthetic protein FlhB
MADSAPDKDERTEPASDKKLEDARKKGSVAKSQDLNAAVMLMFGFCTMLVFGSTTVDQLGAMLRLALQDAPIMTIDRGTVAEYCARSMQTLFIILVPILLTFFVIGFVVNVAQVGLKFSAEALRPKWNRLNPLTGIKRVMLSAHSATELIKGVFKTIIIGLVGYSVVDKLIVDAVMLVDSDVSRIMQFMASATTEVVIKTGMAYAIIAAADFFYQRYEFAKNMRMTKQEVKDEYKMNEGDPHVKGRIKTIQRQIAYKRMMTEVPTANVVITNPTHYAVALKYESGKMVAPKVVAKGMDLIALKIKEIAKAHNVPIVEDRPLAQALYKNVEIGEGIPEKLFQAVAQILAYIYRLKRKPKHSYASMS